MEPHRRRGGRLSGGRRRPGLQQAPAWAGRLGADRNVGRANVLGGGAGEAHVREGRNAGHLGGQVGGLGPHMRKGDGACRGCLGDIGDGDSPAGGGRCAEGQARQALPVVCIDLGACLHGTGRVSMPAVTDCTVPDSCAHAPAADHAGKGYRSVPTPPTCQVPDPCMVHSRKQTYSAGKDATSPAGSD